MFPPEKVLTHPNLILFQLQFSKHIEHYHIFSIYVQLKVLLNFIVKCYQLVQAAKLPISFYHFCWKMESIFLFTAPYPCSGAAFAPTAAEGEIQNLCRRHGRGRRTYRSGPPGFRNAPQPAGW